MNDDTGNRTTANDLKSSCVTNKLFPVKKITKTMKTTPSKKADVANLTMTNRNTFAFWTIVWLIFVLAIGNLVLTLTIFGVLRLGKGMEFLEAIFF